MKNYEYNIEERIKRLWETANCEISEDEIGASWKEVENHISRKRNKRRLYYRISGVAALILVIFSSYFFLNIYSPTIYIANSSSVDKEINLPDGSQVFLKPDSDLSYKENFKDGREVNLKGEAYFNVVKDTLRRFKVITASTTTTVLGTSFLVKEKNNLKDVEVSLYAGKVLASLNGKSRSWTISPGERFIYEKNKTSIEEFETSLSFATGKNFIDVNNLELNKLLNFLENKFNYRFKNEGLTKHKRVTIRINKSDSLKHILSILSTINNFQYEINSEIKEVRILKK